MSRIKIKDFGPIRNGYIDNEGWIDINTITILIGDQGSGKSTIAKLISTFSWIEKDLFRSNGSTLAFHEQEKEFKKNLEYHRINNYIRPTTKIEYEGDAYRMQYTTGEKLIITKNNTKEYHLPKITYFPAERNFISSVRQFSVSSTLKLWSKALQEFKEIYQEAKSSLREHEILPLPFGHTEIEYNKLNDIVYLKGKDYRVRLSESASGFQTYVPLHIVSNYVAQLPNSMSDMTDQQRETFRKESAGILADSTYTDEQKRILLSNLAARFNIENTFNIVEEPEQNLFPSSQEQMLYNLINLTSINSQNKLLLTTHSPYIIGYISLIIKASKLMQLTKKDDIIKKINKIVPINAALNQNSVSIYELSIDGEMSLLSNYNGIPSSKNYLNNELSEKNELFAQLLDIEDLL